MAKAVAIFEGGVSERRQAAVREDGMVFRRAQVRDPRYGYRWSAWRESGEKLGHNALAALDSTGLRDFYRLSAHNSALVNSDGSVRVRLP